MPKKQGHLVIVGGPAERVPDRELLARAAHLGGGSGARVTVLGVGGKLDAEKLLAHARGFEALGVSHVEHFLLTERAHAEDKAIADAVAAASVVVLVGANPQHIASILAGSRVETQVHQSFEQRGACLLALGAATGALSRQMVTEGKSDIHPRAGLISLAPGLAFLDRIVIDHHFSEKQRMGRLLSIVAQAPEFLGVGIDDKTALVVAPGRRLEVAGKATVTILDGRAMSHNSVNDVERDEILAMGNVQLHLLPAGFSFDLEGGLPASRGVIGPKVPPALREVAALLVSASPAGAA